MLGLCIMSDTLGLKLHAADLVVGVETIETLDFHPIDSARHDSPPLAKDPLQQILVHTRSVAQEVEEESLHDLGDLDRRDPQLNVDRLGEVSVHERFCLNVDAKACARSLPVGSTFTSTQQNAGALDGLKLQIRTFISCLKSPKQNGPFHSRFSL